MRITKDKLTVECESKNQEVITRLLAAVTGESSHGTTVDPVQAAAITAGCGKQRNRVDLEPAIIEHYLCRLDYVLSYYGLGHIVTDELAEAERLAEDPRSNRIYVHVFATYGTGPRAATLQEALLLLADSLRDSPRNNRGVALATRGVAYVPHPDFDGDHDNEAIAVADWRRDSILDYARQQLS